MAQRLHREPLPLLNLRDTAVWYPYVPNSTLSFPAASGRIYGPGLHKEPVAMLTRFGELDGKNLIRVTVQVRAHGPGSFAHFLSITSKYQTLWGEEASLLGRHRDDPALEQYDLDLDGHGGERITGFESVYILGTLAGFTVSLDPFRHRRRLENTKHTDRFSQTVARKRSSHLGLIPTWTRLIGVEVLPGTSEWRRARLLVFGESIL
jgi:hypothetical protein